ncbi:MAG: branched-chain amino acid ABC transporter permease [Candidatus Firestonebacteria bacterium]
MFLQQLINGLTLGSIYALIALGYTMVYGILEFINFAHGEIYMVGAYLGLAMMYILNNTFLSHNPLLLISLTFLFSMLAIAGLGVIIEKVAYKPLRNTGRLVPLITALGISIFLQNAVMIIAGSEKKSYPQLFPSGGFNIGDARITYLQIFIIIGSILLMLLLNIFIKNTKLGKAMRATAQDRRTASLMGINVDKIISTTFFIGSALGAAAGIMVGMYYREVNFYMGYLSGIKAFTAAVLGGIGNIPGAMFGGIILGVLESVGTGIISAEYKDIFAFTILILVLIFKPSGLFGKT